MISSRCNDEIEFRGKQQRYSDFRRALTEEIEAIELFGRPIFEAWISETIGPMDGSRDSWEHCLDAVRDADIVLALYNGNAGGITPGGTVGICQAELQEALNSAPAKLRLIKMPSQMRTADPEKKLDERFADYVDRHNLFRGQEASNGDEALQESKTALRDAVINLVQLGVREARRGNYHSGDALDWSRLNYSSRKCRIEQAVAYALESLPGTKRLPLTDGEDPRMLLRIDRTRLLAVIHAIPAAMTVSAAREMVGQPFLRDHELADHMKEHQAYGPIHVLACHRTVTEAQAVRQLGFPDAIIVSAPFGIYLADEVQKIQILFLANCRDELTTRHGVQRAIEWLNQTGEGDLLASRAKSRRKIVTAIANEINA